MSSSFVKLESAKLRWLCNAPHTHVFESLMHSKNLKGCQGGQKTFHFDPIRHGPPYSSNFPFGRVCSSDCLIIVCLVCDGTTFSALQLVRR